MKRRVAIVGGGIAGLSAAHFLHPHHEIALFEKSPRLGGNAYTLKSRDGESVDIAVAAFGRAGYPNFYRLLDDLGVATRACAGSFMSFHDLDKNDGLYLTPGWRGLRRQGFDVLRPQRLAAPAAFFFRKIAKHNDVVSPRAVYSVRAVEGRTRSDVTALVAPVVVSAFLPCVGVGPWVRQA